MTIIYKFSNDDRRVGTVVGGWYDGCIQVQNIIDKKIYIVAPDEILEEFTTMPETKFECPYCHFIYDKSSQVGSMCMKCYLE